MKLKWRQGFRFGVANTFDNSKAFDDVNANNNRGSLDFTLYSVYSNYYFFNVHMFVCNSLCFQALQLYITTLDLSSII